jgi:hypothetical protein
MFKKNSVFPSAECPSEEVSFLEDGKTPSNKYGFFAIGEYLVPYAFVKMLEERSWKYIFNHAEVTSVRQIVGKRLWEKLSEEEKQVVGSCLLLLVDHGHMTNHVTGKKKY